MSLLTKITILLLMACTIQETTRAQNNFPAVAGHFSVSRPGPEPSPRGPYWQQQVDYLIDVSLNEEEHTLDGFVKIVYHNNSPDTLSFIWIHCWPNAYKNDQTAFSNQLLDNGRTDFYFSDKGQRGYINRLDFRVEGIVAKMEDHPQYIDIIKVILPHSLPPDASMTITTPFHVQLPFPFSGNGYNKAAYQITQWYPQPAVYDRNGWHPIPYLDQGGSYSEYGDFDVRITLPKNYTVAATGALLSSDSTPITPSPPASNRTLRYQQKNISGFAWFASRHFKTDHDTLQLESGRIIDVYAYYTPQSARLWQNSIAYIKRAIRFRSSLIGEYPYDVVRVAEIIPAITSTVTSVTTYPTLAGVITPTTTMALDQSIQHAVGYNWFRALGADERTNPWLTEGLNTYYDRRYKAQKYPPLPDAKPQRQPQHQLQRQAHTTMHPKTEPRHPLPNWIKKKLPEDPERLLVNTLVATHRDQPVTTPFYDLTSENYKVIIHAKTAIWLEHLQDSLGTDLFDSSMQTYFRAWSGRHPAPADFRTALEHTSSRNLTPAFAILDQTGPITPLRKPKKIKPAFLFSGRNTDNIDYFNIMPAVGYNTYDHIMIGALIHNFNRPPDAFQFLLAPLYATNSHQFNGVAYGQYSWYSKGRPQSGSTTQKITAALEAAKFSDLSGADSNGHQLFGGFYKLAPSLRLTLKNATARSTMQKWVEWKTYLIGEKELTNYVQKSTDSLSYPGAVGKYQFRYLNQLTFNIGDNRVLYPYNALLQFQQGPRFYRINFTGNYFFNYAAGGGMNLRFFAAKFGHLGGATSSLDLSTYQPKLTGVSGGEDYTYSNYFVGRNEYSGLASQQIMNRDGGLKIRVPSFPWLEGRSDNWVSALNFTSTLPATILPSWLPLKAFLDIGTYAGGWEANSLTSRFLYTAGLQLSLFRDVLTIYAPLFYSSDFSNQLKTIPDQNTFWKRLSFSITSPRLTHNHPFY